MPPRNRTIYIVERGGSKRRASSQPVKRARKKPSKSSSQKPAPVVPQSLRSAPVLYTGTNDILADAAFAPSTRARYDRAVTAFFQFIDTYGWSISSVHELDIALAHYINYKFELGYAPSLGHNTIAGLIRHAPQIRGALPLSAIRMRGWDKLVPSEKRPPLTWRLSLAIAFRCMAWGRVHVAVAGLLAFHCLLRISEFINLRVSDVIDVGDSRFDGVNDKMILRLRTTKTGLNQSVTVFDPLVMKLMRLVLYGRPSDSDEKVFAFSENEFRSSLRAACASLELKDHFTPHSYRHGGCTHFHLVSKMPATEIMIRGRWASTRSFTHYLQEHAAALIAINIPPIVDTIGKALGTSPNPFLFVYALQRAPNVQQVSDAIQLWSLFFSRT